MQAFDSWMRNTVKSIHYHRNDKMAAAYKKLIES